MMARISDRLSGISARWGMLGTAIIAITISIWLGSYQSADLQLRVGRELLFPKAATGDIHIVEIDSRSIREMENWPWKRRIHGALVDQLREAEAKIVAFDVDFSSPSNPEDDQIFSEALNRAGGSAVLPTFRQLVSDTGTLFSENIPIQELRDNAFLGSVNVHPDADGTMRTFSMGTITDNVARPSLAALLAGQSGSVNDHFRLSSAIDPDTVPRHSAMDIIQGRFNPADVKGKTLIVGATAIELGDRYAVDGRGVIPGVVVQALAAETLTQGLDYTNFGPFPAVLLAILSIAYAGSIWSLRKRLARLALAAFAISLAPFTIEATQLGTIEIVPALVGLGVTTFATIFIDYVRRLSLARMSDEETGLSNARALIQTLGRKSDGTLIVMSLKSFRAITVQLNAAELAALYEQIVARIQTVFGTVKIFHLGDGRLAWINEQAQSNAMADAIDSLAAMFLSKFQLVAHQIVATPAFGLAEMQPKSASLVVQQGQFAANRALELGHRWVRYGDEMGDSAVYEQKLLADLDEAIASRDIYPVYQPKWSITEQRISGVEALLRWNHKERGAIRPDHFIPILEEHGRMQEVTLYVFDCCVEQAARWKRQGRDIKVALNVSAPLFADPAFTAILFERVKSLGDLATKLMIEITESAVVTNTDTTIETLNALRILGIGVSIDDYGTGQSTLSYLKRFPADEIKIDQSFVSRMLDSASDQILVRSTIELAHELGFSVVAEGVEDSECLAKLTEFGCDTVQGWHISKPKSVAEIDEMIAGERLANAA